MSQAVVDVLEMIDVEDSDRHLVFVTTSRSELMLEQIVEERTGDLRKLNDHLINMRYIDRSVITSGLLGSPMELLDDMLETSSKLCTYLHKNNLKEVGNAEVVHRQIRQCVKNMSEFMEEANAITDSGESLSEKVQKLSEKMMQLSGEGLRISVTGNSLIFEAASNQVSPLSSIHSEAARFSTRRTTFNPRLIVLALRPCLRRKSIQGCSVPRWIWSIKQSPIQGIRFLSRSTSLCRLRLCLFSSTNFAAACSKIRWGLTPNIFACLCS